MACSKPFDNATMRARATQLTELFKKEKIPLECVYTSWEDAMRAFGSALGPNIADIGLQFKSTDGSATKVYGFKCRSNNFAEVLVEIDARKYKIIVCDPNGQNPRGIYLDDALKNAGKYFAHCGLPDDCDLYDEAVDNGKVKLRMDVIFAPKGAIPEGQEFANTEFCLTKYSYQARTGNSRNIDLFSHPQGTACSDDTSGQKMLRPQVYDPETKKLNEFWFEAEDTGKDVEDMHTETAAESAAAAARGKGTAVRSGMDGWEKLPNLFHFIQIPREQERSVPVRSSISQPYASAGAAGGSASAWAEGPPTKSFKASAGASMPPSGLDPDEEEEDVQEEEGKKLVWRSFGRREVAIPNGVRTGLPELLTRGAFPCLHSLPPQQASRATVALQVRPARRRRPSRRRASPAAPLPRRARASSPRRSSAPRASRSPSRAPWCS